jgi:CelD/BcsL family acetyltransferase involved in cellulose biosynthesis
VGGLQAAAPCSSAQTYDWAKASARHLLGPEGREPVIAVACADDGRPLFLWPFEMAPAAGMKVLCWLGQDHAITLGDFAALYEKRLSSRHALERNARKLAEAGPLEFGWAETRDQKLALLDTLFAQKSRQFAAMGVKDIFDAHARAFYGEVALLEGDNPSRVRLGYLKLGDTVLATFSGTICHRRLSAVLSSLAKGETQKQSPGALLLRHQIEEASRQGLAFYDIGVGAARHKDQWADQVQPLFDNFIAFKPHAHLLTLPLAASARLKRAIKSNRHLWPPGAAASPAPARSRGTAQLAAARASKPERGSLPFCS